MNQVIESKIKKLFHYTTFESALKIIETCSLKLTNPKDLNDPFECDPCVKKKSDYLPDELASLCQRHILLNTELCQMAYEDWSRLKLVQPFPDYFKENFNPDNIDFQEEMGKSVRLISFSQDANVIPMWAHYAENHRGVVIEFDLNVMPFSGLLITKGQFQTVTYSEKRVDYDLLKIRLSTQEEQLKKFFEVAFTKSKSWEVENEVRIILPLQKIKEASDPNISQFIRTDSNDNLFLLFPPESIRTIYCGLRMPPVNESIISKLLKSREENLHTPIIKMEQSKTQYDFRPFSKD